MRTPLLILCILALGAAASAGQPELLPDASLRLEASRYAPVETDLHWDSWIGGGASLVRWDAATAYLTADLETVLGNTRRTFDATQANYHLEVGGWLKLGEKEVSVFFNHVSRHVVDRPKPEAVDWNVLGARVMAPLPRWLAAPGRVTLGVGHTTQESSVGYRWEVTARVEADLVGRGSTRLYATADARLVTAEASPRFPRGDFVDFNAEGGVRFSNGARALQFFAAFDHRNDVFVETPGVRDRAQFGFRIGVGPSSPLP